MRILLLLLLPAAAMIAGSCNDEEVKKVVPPPANFQPVGGGSSWIYSEYPVVNVYTVTMTGLRDTVGNRVLYQLYNTRSGYSWFTKYQGAYYSYITQGSDTLKMLYLKDNLTIGASWDDIHDIGGFETRYHYTVLEFNVPSLVAGRVYDQCIKLERATYVDFGVGNDSLVATELQTYANDVGLVLIDKGDLGYTYLSNYKIY